MTFKQRCYSLSLSVALHLGLAALLVCSYITTTQTPTIGVNSEANIHSYIASQTLAPVNASQPKTVPHPPLSTTGSMVSEDEIDDDTANAASQTLATQAATATTTPSTASSGDHPDALLALLHDAILAKQHYPSSALTMKRYGTVQVGFLLSPDGVAHDIQLLHSSGTDSLDQSALQAIQDASPFHGVAAYLSQNKPFSLDIVFTLPT